MLSSLLQGLQDPPLASRQHYLKHDRAVALAAFAAALSVAFIMLLLDFASAGASKDFLLALAVGILLILGTLGIGALIRRSMDVDQYERLALAWTLGTALLMTALTLLQPLQLLQNLAVNLLLLIAVHLLVNNRLYYRLMPAAIISTAGLLVPIFYFLDLTGQQTALVILVVVALNGIGLTIVARENLLKAEAFESTEQARGTRDEFEARTGLDQLTGIYNRRHFMDAFDLEFSRSKRYKSAFSFALISLDKFDELNQARGMVAGELALRAFAGLVTAGKRKTDIFGRLDGQDFGLIMMETSGDDTLKTVQRYLTDINETVVPLGHAEFQFTFSAGVTEFHEPDRAVDDMMRRSDKALLTARELGGSCCILN